MVTRFAGIGLDIATMNVGIIAILVRFVGHQEETGVFLMQK
jgi:hypothetical protein